LELQREAVEITLPKSKEELLAVQASTNPLLPIFLKLIKVAHRGKGGRRWLHFLWAPGVGMARVWVYRVRGLEALINLYCTIKNFKK